MTIYRDINLAFTRHPVTNDVTTVTDVTAVKRALKNLVLMNFFEAPLEPKKGSGLRNLLFENFNPFTISSVKQKLQEVVERYEPRITINEIRIYGQPDQHAIQVTIVFRINAYQTLDKIELILERTR